jgi:hypothetical protein
MLIAMQQVPTRETSAAITAQPDNLFRLHALDVQLEVGFRAGRPELAAALVGHVLATAELMGTYER